jgi:uncharacterized protein YndB with AHSA1/START domain
MSTRPVTPVTHATFVIERTFSAPPPTVFAAWSSQQAKARWFVGPDEWVSAAHELDFRVGGRERVAGGEPGGDVHTFEATYHDIVPDQRIISTYDMYVGDQRISVSLAAVELEPAGTGTRLTYTEHGAFFNEGTDGAASREHGTNQLLDQLTAVLESQPVTAG